MKANSNGIRLCSLLLLAGGGIAALAALVLDFTGSRAGFRGPTLILGVLAFFVGLYLYPTLVHHRRNVYIIFLFPLLFAFAVTVVIPLFLGIFYSMTDWTGIQFSRFVGFSNYVTMFGSPDFIWSILMTFVFVVLNMVLVNLVAFLLALLCTSGVRGGELFPCGLLPAQSDRRYCAGLYLAVCGLHHAHLHHRPDPDPQEPAGGRLHYVLLSLPVLGRMSGK